QIARFRCHLDYANDASSAHAHLGLPGGRILERLPGPHLTRSSAPSPCRSPRRSSANAAQGGLTPPPEGRRRRANKPPSPAQHRLHEDRAYINPPSAFVTHGCRTNQTRYTFLTTAIFAGLVRAAQAG